MDKFIVLAFVVCVFVATCESFAKGPDAKGWTEWSACTKECGGGERFRKRPDNTGSTGARLWCSGGLAGNQYEYRHNKTCTTIETCNTQSCEGTPSKCPKEGEICGGYKKNVPCCKGLKCSTTHILFGICRKQGKSNW